MSAADRVREALTRVADPELRRPITELDMVGTVSVDDGGLARVEIDLTVIGCPAAEAIERDVRQVVLSVDGVSAAEIAVGVMSPERRQALVDRLRPARTMPFGPGTLTRVIAVSSGKGGVGKSTVTANLAVALAARGLAVGLIDADVHGFSIPGLLGLDAGGSAPRPTRVGELILPPVAHGVKTISIGMFLDDPGGAVAWRGPMLHRTLNQFLTDVYFGALDVLLLDLPPGTGDVAISLGQLLPNAEVLVVTTPQPAAAEVAWRSGTLARQTGQRVIGVVENMAAMTGADGALLELFGSGGGADAARRLSTAEEVVPLLGSIPLSVALRTGGDTGRPVVLAHPEDPAAVALAAVADRLAGRGRDLAGRALPVSPR